MTIQVKPIAATKAAISDTMLTLSDALRGVRNVSSGFAEWTETLPRRAKVAGMTASERAISESLKELDEFAVKAGFENRSALIRANSKAIAELEKAYKD